MKKTILILAGPTASGKSQIALEIAARLGGEIISADSMQVYRGMDIGTAKPTLQERSRINHHLIDILNPDQEFSVYDFCRLTLDCLKHMDERGIQPIIAGGTGLYIRSLIQGLKSGPGQNRSLRELLRTRAKEMGTQNLYQEFLLKYPHELKNVNSNDLKRIIRTIEKKESIQEKTEQPIFMFPTLQELGYKFLFVVISKSREWLYESINARTDQMIKSGWADEVQRLKHTNLSKTASQALGYKQLLEYFDTESTSLQSVVDIIKQKTRNFAKRQITWFKKDPYHLWIELAKTSKIDTAVMSILELFKRS